MRLKVKYKSKMEKKNKQKKQKHMEYKQYATRQPISHWKQSKRRLKNTKRQMKMEPHKSKSMG